MRVRDPAGVRYSWEVRDSAGGPGPPAVLAEGYPRDTVAKMASHAIFQYNIFAIDDTHNTWTNMIVKMIILRLLGSSSSDGSTGRTDA